MSKQIFKLRVPADPGEGYPEFVAHGELEATLVPGEIFETGHSQFARFLQDRYQLELIETVDVEEEATDEKAADDGDADSDTDSDTIDPETYPADFPARKVLIGHNVAYETAIASNAEQLQGYKGIGPKLANEIVEYVANGGTE